MRKNRGKRNNRIMTGTFLNIATVLLGGTLGLIFGARLPARIRETVIMGLGLFTAGVGILMFLETSNPLIALGSLLIGGILGEWWKIETKLINLGEFLERKYPKGQTDTSAADRKQVDLSQQALEFSNFARGFLSASLLFCVGPMTILGSIQDGLTGDFELLAIKSVLDGFAAFAFASTLGVGVIFSVLTILVFQGGLSLVAAQAQNLLTDGMVNEMTAVGGLMLLGLSISSLLEIRPIRVGNFLPALVVAPLIVAVLIYLGINL